LERLINIKDDEDDEQDDLSSQPLYRDDDDTTTPTSSSTIIIIIIGVDLTAILGGAWRAYYKSPAVEAKNTFFYIAMQVIWCLKFCNMTKSGGTIPSAPDSGGSCPLHPPVIYAHDHHHHHREASAAVASGV